MTNEQTERLIQQLTLVVAHLDDIAGSLRRIANDIDRVVVSESVRSEFYVPTRGRG